MELVEGVDYYWEGDLVVFTRDHHLRRGHCCGSGCRHCPYQPRWTAGVTTIASEESQSKSTSPASTD
jgi:hypothetical protein